MKHWALVLAALLPLAAQAFEINDASRARLEQLDGVGVTMADRILAERAKAPFADWSDLQRRVKGLSGQRLKQWQAQGVTVNADRGAATAAVPRAAPGEAKERTQ